MAVFLAGATGFLGGHLACVLAERGERVRALVRHHEDDSRLRALGIEIVRGDLADAKTSRRAARGCRLAFNCIGLVSFERRDLARLREANVESVRRVVEALDPEARLVHVSSLAAIGPAPTPASFAVEQQQFPPEAVSIPYCATKREGEQVALDAAERGRDVVIANPSVAFGPGDLAGSSTWPVTHYLSGRLRAYVDGGSAHVDVRDIAAGLATLAKRGRTGERYILTAPDANLSWAELFRLVSEVTGVRRTLVRIPGRLAQAGAAVLRWPQKPGRVHAARLFWYATAAKAEQELGFRTRPFAETVAASAAGAGD
ncbi:MAG TPA: NAD-dependent epimerase/dehydratase family protein [Gaiellaceae bacterium]|nr:NAD-dependent epimerase/dehydratase family protein [Gaiellaceae bacterium]